MGTDCTIGENVTNDGEIGNKVTIEEGTKIGRNATIGDKSKIGEYCKIGNYSIVDEEVKIERNVEIHEKGFVGKEVEIGHSVEVGQSAVIYEPLRIYKMRNGESIPSSFGFDVRIPKKMKFETGEIVIGAPYTYQLYAYAEESVDENSLK